MTVGVLVGLGMAFITVNLQAEQGMSVVREELARRLPDAPCAVSEVGAVIGVHSGPGMVAVAIAPGAPA